MRGLHSTGRTDSVTQREWRVELTTDNRWEAAHRVTAILADGYGCEVLCSNGELVISSYTTKEEWDNVGSVGFYYCTGEKEKQDAYC